MAGAGHPYSREAIKRARKKYNKKLKDKYDTIKIRIPKSVEIRNKIDEHIKTTGENMTKFVLRAILETIANDTEKNQNNDN